MADLAWWQMTLIGLLFVWGGFVRSGLGFGGAVLTLPFLLMVYNAPLVYLPIISVHLLFFSGLTIVQAHVRARGTARSDPGTVNWPFLRYALALMLVPKLIGVAGVLTLPASVVSSFIFVVVGVYAVSYILQRPFKSNSRRVDAGLLMLGGYVSGTSLIAAPLVVPVAASRVARHELRDTLFVLWFVLVAIKLAAFAWTGVDLQWRQHLWLLPCAAIGHVLGLRFHAYTLRADTGVFFRVLGVGLLAVSLVGLARMTSQLLH
ncbi:MAG TPA: permease [Haliea salexigens]|mgnify:FL=1|uniref:Probable membrane transporter protein n=1 Tax=Haliea salexigens TaxID=287487 RepID=A0A3C1KQ19_9GAMM|nr:permease [Haliea sp.]HAN28757.1 permease [Haliea salexigens]|tara:strand:+ start:3829 stop:4614 length:786 start_codon:yes stop_codon:yes gene_type:complete